MHFRLTVVTGVIITLIACGDASESNPGSGDGMLKQFSIDTPHVPGGVLEYAAWEPEAQPMGLVILLHGGGGSRDNLDRHLAEVRTAIVEGRLIPSVWSTPSAQRSFYMDYRDGSELWERAVMEDYLPRLMDQYGITDPAKVVIAGASMGGMGSLRLAFKYPDAFGAVAALEPAVEAALSWEDVTISDTYYRQDMYTEKFGNPVDEAYWAANHPAAIAHAAPRRLDKLNIYFEVGDEDDLKLYRGGEFLHRVLFDHGVRHEFRLVRGADHISPNFMNRRFISLLDFVGRHYEPVEEGVVTAALKKALALARGDHIFPPDVPLPPHRRPE